MTIPDHTRSAAAGGQRYALPARCRATLVALAVDHLAGELPNQLHPVVVMGRFLAWGERRAPAGGRARLAWGAIWLAGGAGLSALLAGLVPHNALIQGAVASTLLAYRQLDRAVGEVQAALRAGDLQEARRLLGWHLVSRPAGDLDAAEVAGAAIESLAENLSDSLVGPVCWYLLGGLPALAAYRFVNTADAMWGYRNPRYEQLGKAAARTDDLLNLMPARLTALLIVLAAQALERRGAQAWHVAARDHGRTASPNAGWPMAAMAGALGTTLTKRGQYRLGDGACAPDAHMIDRARSIGRCVVLCTAAALALGLRPPAIGTDRCLP